MDGLEKIEARICCCRLNAALLDAVPLQLPFRHGEDQRGNLASGTPRRTRTVFYFVLLKA